MTKDNSVAWIKMPTAHLMDERIENLIEKDGAAGFGVYMLLIFELYRQRSHKMTIKKMLSRKYKGCSQTHLRHVIEDYGLFNIDENDHVTSAIDYCIGYSSVAHLMRIGCDSDSLPSPARIKKTQTQTLYSSDYRRRNIAAVDDIFREMETWGPWSETVAMNSGFSRLLRDHWKEAIDWFRRHVAERSKESELLTIDDARRYLADLIHHPTTAARLQQHLQKAEDEARPYPFEDPTSRPGARTYMGGMPIPDDAPARPTARARWTGSRWEEF